MPSCYYTTVIMIMMILNYLVLLHYIQLSYSNDEINKKKY